VYRTLATDTGLLNRLANVRSPVDCVGAPKLWRKRSTAVCQLSAGVGTQMWDYQMVAFAAEGYRCTSFSGYDYDTFADDVHSVIEAQFFGPEASAAMMVRPGSLTAHDES
jgi:hypothetical protein